MFYKSFWRPWDRWKVIELERLTSKMWVFRGILFIYFLIVRVIDIYSVISNYKSINSRRVINAAIQSISFLFDGDNKPSWNCNYPGVFVEKKLIPACKNYLGCVLDSRKGQRDRGLEIVLQNLQTSSWNFIKTKLRMTTFVILSCAANNMQYAFRRWSINKYFVICFISSSIYKSKQITRYSKTSAAAVHSTLPPGAGAFWWLLSWKLNWSLDVVWMRDHHFRTTACANN